MNHSTVITDDNEDRENDTTAKPTGGSAHLFTLLDHVTKAMEKDNVPQEVIEQYRADAISTLSDCLSPHNT